jgi:hypothetical protein
MISHLQKNINSYPASSSLIFAGENILANQYTVGHGRRTKLSPFLFRNDYGVAAAVLYFFLPGSASFLYKHKR